MKTRLSFLTFVLTVFSLFAAKKPDAKSVYLEQLSATPAIESLHDFMSVDNDKAFIRMFHNDANLKVQIIVPDKGMQAKFLVQGLQVYLDISGKKGKKYCISFPKSDMEQMRRGMQPQREPGQQRPEPGQQRPSGERPEGRQQMNIDLKPMIEQVGGNSALLISGKNEALLDAGRVNMKPLEEWLLYTIQIPLSSLGGKLGKDNIVSIGLLAEMDMSQMMGMAGGMGFGGQGGARTRPDGGNAGNPGNREGREGREGAMRQGGQGGMSGIFADFAAPFDTWVTFGLK